MLHTPGKLQMPPMAGLNNDVASPNPFSGIKRTGQAKRAMNFEKWQGSKGPSAAGADAPDKDFGKASFDGAKNQLIGGAHKTQFGSTRPAKF